jgi:hypothetical protein
MGWNNKSWANTYYQLLNSLLDAIVIMDFVGHINMGSPIRAMKPTNSMTSRIQHLNK